jgi:hypothetical protein
MGYGLGAERIEAELLGLFLKERAQYAARVAKHKQDGNEALFGAVDKILAGFAKQRAKKKA